MKIIKLLLITTAAAAVLFGSGTSNAAKQVAQHHKAQKHEKTLIEVINPTNSSVDTNMASFSIFEVTDL